MSKNCRQTKITDFRISHSTTTLDQEAPKDRPEVDTAEDDIQRKRKSKASMSNDDLPPQKCFRRSTSHTSDLTAVKFSRSQKEDETKEEDVTKDPRKSENDDPLSDDSDKKSHEDKVVSEDDENDDQLSDDSDKEPHERKLARDPKCIENDDSDSDDSEKESHEATRISGYVGQAEENPSPTDNQYFSSGSHEAQDHEHDHQADDSDENPMPKDDYEDDYDSACGSAKKAGTPLENLSKVCSSNRRELDEHKLKSSKSHFVLMENKDKASVWNEKFVRMPHDSNNEMVVFKNKRRETEKRWDIIQKTYQRNIRDVFQLEEAILSYNGHRRQMWNFQCLEDYFLEHSSPENKTRFFERVLPEIISHAMDLEAYFTVPIPLLKKNENLMVTMSQGQAACILANAFLCTFPWRNKGKRNTTIGLPTINFDSLFNSPTTPNRLEKITCIIHYFERVTEKMPEGNITFRRQVVCDTDFPDWEETNRKFTELHVSSEGSIEDDGAGMLQVDFANKFVGGGVIGHGCVQEEIRFMICPEMIVSRLITEVLEDNEVLIMTGCERFSNYSGYGDTFKWTGNHMDNTERDAWNRKYTEVVAMDALHIGRNEYSQFSNHMVDRELNKAYCAFLCKEKYQKKIPAVSTGNWGCGAFRGDKELKALIQLIAASYAGRDVLFLTFNDERFVCSLNYVHSKIKENSFDTGNMVKLIRKFNQKKHHLDSSLFRFLKSSLA